MNTAFKKTALASALVVGLAVSLVLQAHENPDTPNQGSATEGRGSMPMNMDGMKGMMGMMGMMQMMGSTEQMSEMMATCAKVMKAHAKGDPASTEQSSAAPSS